jgi:hypothetical protein
VKKHYHVKGYFEGGRRTMLCPIRATLAEARRDAKAWNDRLPDHEWVIQRCGHVECLGRMEQ